MAFSKVILDDTTLMDVTQKTVESGKMLYGETALKNDGTDITGIIANKGYEDISISGNNVTIPAGSYAQAVNITAGTDVSEDTVIADALLDGYTAHKADGTVITGNIQSLGATTYNVSSSAQTISSGQYIYGDQTIRAVTTSNITAANIKDGVVVKVGDAGSATRIKNVTGTFTDASTVSSGQTAAAAANIHSGYSAWVDGAEVKGSAYTYDQGVTQGWSDAWSAWNYPSTGTTSSFKVTWPGSTHGTTTSRTYTLSCDDNYAYIKYSSSTYARITNSAYANGQSAGQSTGWTAAYNGSVYPSSSSTSSYCTVKTPSDTYGSFTTTNYYVTCDDSYAYVKKGSTSGTTVARVSNSAYSNGQSSGWAIAYNGSSAPSSSSTSQYCTVKIPSSTYNSFTSTNYYVTCDDSYAYIKKTSTSGTTVARVSNSAYNNGWGAAVLQCDIPRREMSSSSFTVYYPISTVGQRGSCTYALSKDSSYVYIKTDSITVAKLAL